MLKKKEDTAHISEENQYRYKRDLGKMPNEHLNDAVVEDDRATNELDVCQIRSGRAPSEKSAHTFETETIAKEKLQQKEM